MDKRLFERLVESMQQHEEIRRGERVPSREFFVDAEKVKEIRAMTGLSQSKFARLLDVDVGTLRNWEQGRRRPTGPARALLRAIKRDPKSVLKALAAPRPFQPCIARSLRWQQHNKCAGFRRNARDRAARRRQEW